MLYDCLLFIIKTFFISFSFDMKRDLFTQHFIPFYRVEKESSYSILKLYCRKLNCIENNRKIWWGVIQNWRRKWTSCYEILKPTCVSKCFQSSSFIKKSMYSFIIVEYREAAMGSRNIVMLMIWRFLIHLDPF